MPAVIAQLLRFVIIAAVQSGFIIAAESLLNPLIDKAKEGIKSTFGLSDDDALTYIANFVLDVAELTGLTVIALKSRIPIKIADKLGLTSRGFKRGALPAKVSTGSSAPGAVAKAAAAAGPITQDVIATGVAATKGIAFSRVQTVLLTIAGVVGGTTYTLSTIGNWIDFGNWNSGAYQGTFQKIFAVVGLKPDEPLPKATTVSSDVWDRVYNTYRELGAYAINDPFKMQSVVFSRQALIDLVDKIGAQLNAETGSAPAKAVLGATAALVQIAAQSPGTPRPTTSSSSTSSPSQGTTTSNVKVFTGVLSQGVLGNGLQFAARPDDLIESVQELQDAASNNLAAALAALPSSLSYEMKIVSSIITKDGFKQTGTTQQVISGYSSNGTAKYKTVSNKFAVLDIYLMNEKGTRTKVRQIVLGPTNILKFNPTPAQIVGITNAVRNDVITSNTADISSVITNVPVENTATKPKETNTNTQNTQATISSSQKFDAGGGVYYTVEGPNNYTYHDSFNRTIENITWAGLPQNVRDAISAIQPSAASSGTNTGGGSSTTNNTSTSNTQNNSSSSASGSSVASATTLSGYFAARGQSLPSLSERALIYQGFGLGQASYYTGTAEQNTKLLAALKAHS